MTWKAGGPGKLGRRGKTWGEGARGGGGTGKLGGGVGPGKPGGPWKAVVVVVVGGGACKLGGWGGRSWRGTPDPGKLGWCGTMESLEGGGTWKTGVLRNPGKLGHLESWENEVGL